MSELRALQDWHLRFALGSVPGVAEVASIGGFVRQYQVTVDPIRLAAYGISIREVAERIRRSNRDVEGRLLEMGGREYMVRGRGYLRGTEDLRAIVLGASGGTPVLLGDVAHVALGPDIRRGLAELDGRGEVVGGIVVMRHGENALRVIRAVKEKLEEIAPGLPAGVRIVPTYDRSELLLLSIATLRKTLLVEIAAVSLAVTLVPVRMTLFLSRGRIRSEFENPVSRLLHRIYEPVLRVALRRRKTALFLNALLIPASLWFALGAGSEFMPPLYEETIFYMPVTGPGVSVTEAARLLTLQDRILKGFAEVERVFGKAGRAETATDPAPFRA